MGRGSAGIFSRKSKTDFMTGLEALLEGAGYSIFNTFTGGIEVWDRQGNDHTVDRKTALSMLIEEGALVSYWNAGTSLPVTLKEIGGGLVMASAAIDGYEESEQLALYSLLVSGMASGDQVLIGFYLDRSDILEILSEQMPVDLSALADDEAIFREFCGAYSFRCEIAGDIGDMMANGGGIIVGRTDAGTLQTYFLS